MNRLTAAFQTVGESRPGATEEMFDLHNAFHAQIDAHCARGDPEAAERAVRANWDNSATRLVQALDRVGQRGDRVLREPIRIRQC